MKTKMIIIVLSVFMMLCVTVCSDNTEIVNENHDSSAVISESEDVETKSTEETVLSED